MLCNPNTNKQWKLKYYYYHVTYFAIVNCITAQILDPVTQEEIFGSGQSSKNNQANFYGYISSSTEDLIKLFNHEKFLASNLTNMKEAEGYLKQINPIHESFSNAEDYVYNPINAFHLLTRNAKFLPKLFPNYTLYTYLFPNMTKTMQQAAFGIVDIQEFYNLNTTDIVNGVLNLDNGLDLRSHRNISLDEVLLISNAAEKSQYFDRKLEWLQSALSLVQNEKSKKKIIEKKIKDSKIKHDKAFEIISKPGTFQIARLWVWTRDSPFEKDNKSLKKLQKKRAFRMLEFEKNLENLLYATTSKDRINHLLSSTKSKDWLNHDVMFHMKVNLRRKTQSLCSNKFVRPADLEKDLKCTYLNHDNPYLKIAPFKYESLNKRPNVGFVHDLISSQEASKMKVNAKSKMKTTPYSVGDNQDAYSRWRTSKVMYTNERQNMNTKRISRKIELVTKCVLAQNKYDSENFQVMNYGMGGLISSHVDSTNWPDNDQLSSEVNAFGGVRFITFMVYLSDVLSGGHTVFPQLGLSAKPVEGSALFWFNIGPNMHYDSRVLHLGCPVVHGNKWIANKWIKILSQFKQYPCTISNNNNKHYGINNSY